MDIVSTIVNIKLWSKKKLQKINNNNKKKKKKQVKWDMGQAQQRTNVLGWGGDFEISGIWARPIIGFSEILDSTRPPPYSYNVGPPMSLRLETET